jgi:hypothetical protein
VADLANAVADSVAALDLPARDRAAAELAHQLAREIDSAAGAERLADVALSKLDRDSDVDLEELIRALKAKVSHRDALVRCGQRLESLLVQLGATPGSRGKATGATPATFGGPLAVLRGGAAGVS